MSNRRVGGRAAAVLAVMVSSAAPGTQSYAEAPPGSPVPREEPAVEPLRDTELAILLDRLTTAYASGDPDLFASHFAEDVEVRDINRRQIVRGREAWRELARRVMAVHTWMTLEAEPFAVHGDSAAVRLHWSGRLQGAALGRRDDLEYSYDGVALMTFVDGLVAGHELFIDYASFLDQLGDPDAGRRTASAEETWERYVEAWASGDVERILPFFEADARLMPGGSDAEIAGRAAFGAWLRASTRGVRFSVALDSRELTVHGVEAVRRGRYRTTFRGADGAEAYRSGWFLQVWHLDEDGSWRVRRGLFNRDE